MGQQPSKTTTTPPPIKAIPRPVMSEKSAPPPYTYAEDTNEDLSSVTSSSIDKWNNDLESNPTLLLSRLVLSKADPITSLSSRSAIVDDEKVFNVRLKGQYPGPIVNQAKSGRCWLFATTNVLRYNVIETLKLGDFQLSQSYLFFYDKLEKSNYYLENVLELLDEPIDGRLMSYLNGQPVGDGGQWDMAYNLIAKYGIIPQTLYPESYSSSASSTMDKLLTSKLREYAMLLRSTKADISTLRKMKKHFLGEIYNTLSIAMGTPPRPDEALTWNYYDKDEKYHSWTGSPKDFYAAFGRRKGMDPKDSFSLVNDPRNEYGKMYTVKKLGNVWGARPVRYVNIPVDSLEDAVIAGIKAGTPLFFGCDVGKSSESLKGIMDTRLYDLQAAYGYTLNMDKAQRLLMGDSSATHAMVITAVQVDDSGRPIKYKVENSWSSEAGEKGWFMMTSAWFREFVYQVVVPRSIAEKRWTEVLDGQELMELEPWDPMGALA